MGQNMLLRLLARFYYKKGMVELIWDNMQLLIPLTVFCGAFLYVNHIVDLKFQDIIVASELFLIIGVTKKNN